MAEDTTQVETAKPEAPSNEAGNTPAPSADNKSADVETAKKEAEQARLRANQLQNELDKIKADQEAARQKQLEEKEEFKTLYEQTQSKLNEIENAQAEAERRSALTAATDELFKEYPSNVVSLAKTAGLSLTDDSEEAKTALKEKLDAFKENVSPAPTVTPNNPSETQSAVTPEQIKSSMSEARKNETVVTRETMSNYILELPAIKRMKELANGA